MNNAIAASKSHREPPSEPDFLEPCLAMGKVRGTLRRRGTARQWSAACTTFTGGVRGGVSVEKDRGRRGRSHPREGRAHGLFCTSVTRLERYGDSLSGFGPIIPSSNAPVSRRLTRFWRCVMKQQLLLTVAAAVLVTTAGTHDANACDKQKESAARTASYTAAPASANGAKATAVTAANGTACSTEQAAACAAAHGAKGASATAAAATPSCAGSSA